MVKSRNYVQCDARRMLAGFERPSYYLDLSQPFVGGRPVYQSHNVNAIPNTMRYDTINLSNRDFCCQQPYWTPSCL